MALFLVLAVLPGCNRVELTTVVDRCDACGGDCVEEEVDIGRRTHEEGPIAYDPWPPAGGPHNACWAPWGIHDDPVPAPLWVHNLEHGGIVLLVDGACDCPDEIARLEALVTAWPEGTALLTEADDLPSPIVAIAWKYRLLLGCADEERIQAFYADHLDQAPERVRADPSGSCM